MYARSQARTLVLVSLCLAAFATGGCATPAVGDPCLPEQVPDNGFSDSEAYVESSSVQCQTRVCMVYHLDGDPREDCLQRMGCQVGGATPCPEDALRCADENETEKRVYCTCRCDSGNTGFAECECPDGFTCVDVLEQGGPGVRGGYCVKNGTSAVR
jgi:hypothetical protein